MSAAILLAILSFSNNQALADADEPFWGAGVKNPDALRHRLENVVSRKGEEYGPRAVGMFSVMTWKQAAYVYRKASIELKGLMCGYVIEGNKHRFIGWTRKKVVTVLGKPDGKDRGEHGIELIYTGEGRVSDSTSGYIFQFDSDGRLEWIVSAN